MQPSSTEVRVEDRRTEVRSHAKALEVLGSLDYENMIDVGETALDVLREVAADRSAMFAALAQLRERPEMFTRCEMDDFFYRIVLCEDPDTGVSLRLQFLKGIKHEQPHNHRAAFASLLLSGGYRHSLYQLPDELLARADTELGQPNLTSAEIARLRPAQTRFESTGSFYALHHTAFHTTIPTSDHVSLVVRGPSARRRLLIVYQDERAAEWLYGGAEETPEQLRKKKLPASDYEQLVARVAQAI